MPTELDDELVPEVLAIIDELGKLVAFSVPTGGAGFNVATGDVDEARTTYNRKISPPAGYDKRDIDGDMILAGDFHCLVAASGLQFTPSKRDTLTLDGEIWQVMSCPPIYSGEQICAYRLQLRKSASVS